jgi:hypothetical protein
VASELIVKSLYLSICLTKINHKRWLVEPKYPFLGSDFLTVSGISLVSPLWERPERFFHYGTLTEAYVKARGKGLSIPLITSRRYARIERGPRINGS